VRKLAFFVLVSCAFMFAAEIVVNPTIYPLLVQGQQAQVNGHKTILSGQFLDTRTKEKQKFVWQCDYPIVVKDQAIFPGKQSADHTYMLVLRKMGTKDMFEVECRD